MTRATHFGQSGHALAEGYTLASPVPGYRIERLLGRGAMSRVYLAVQESTGRRLALKVLDGHYAAVEDVSLRFLHEGRMLARLQHRNVVRLYDVGLVDEVHYMSTELLEGGDLRERLRAPVPLGAALAWVEAIARGLACAHAQGIVHRDLKPQNILFRRDGSPVLTDFGVAKDLSGEVQFTQDGSIIGSLAYLSPEQAEGRAPTPCTDIYGLGLVLFELLTGQPPREPLPEPAEMNLRRSLELALAAVHKPLPRLPTELNWLQPLLDRMTAPEAVNRLQSAETLVESLVRLRRAYAAVAPRAPATPAAPAPAGSTEAASAHNLLCWEIYRDHMIDALGIPALPGVVLRLRKAMEKPGFDLPGLARLVRMDASLADYLMRVAGTALCAAGRPVLEELDALEVLGPRTARDLATRFAVQTLLGADSRSLGPRVAQVWTDSCRVAATSLLLARASGLADPMRAMVAGLLHDVGRMVVLARAQAHARLAADAAQLEEALERLGARVGATVLEKWDFPEEFIAAALWSREWSREEEGESLQLHEVVRLARLLTLERREDLALLLEAEEIPAARKMRQARGKPLELALVESAQSQLEQLSRALQG